MFRALLELLFSIFIIMVARSILTAAMKGLKTGTASAFQQGAQAQDTAQQAAGAKPQQPSGTELHKDPVCGMYVAESTQFRRNAGRETFYYCSADCRAKHSPVAH